MDERGVRPFERVVLRLADEGMSTSEIAWRFRRSPGHIELAARMRRSPGFVARVEELATLKLDAASGPAA